ncbi:DUF6758 family protein [Marmoricola endophyticus]|uniref:DUF6758 family protein n=1 Tax=Marmoricola endophyticus TaxID=2040280 RepID=UPI001E3DE1FA|nr:DUF6758 family protein [Marmoricola endophyticus]
MSLTASCCRCARPVGSDGTCPTHGPVPALWRRAAGSEASYDDFAAVLRRSDDLPVLVPWPMSAGWTVADFGVVATEDEHALATVAAVSGTSSLDGEVGLSLVVEEPRVGLGGRCSGTGELDPGEWVGAGPPAVRVQVERRSVALWPAASSDADDVLARSVFVGEYAGRWLWLVVTPASAALLLRDDWLLADASGFGPEAVEMSFGGAPADW